MSIIQQEAPPLSLRAIEASAWRFRVVTGQDEDPWLPVDRILEHGLPLIFGEDAHFELKDRKAMGDNHALADPDRKVIFIREDVYDGLCSAVGRDRMTVMHEFAHLTLHAGGRLARRIAARPPETFRDPEWQAKAWAGAVMMPARLMGDPRRSSATDISREFDVSLSAAQIRLQQVIKLNRIA